MAQEAPDALVKRVSQEVLAIIKSDPKVQAGDQARIREVVETKLLPNFDFERLTALAMGRNWRQATPEQQKQLVEQFRTLLVRTYSGALTQYRDQTMDYKPLRADANATDVTVRTEVVRQGQAPVPIDYSMTKTASGWKVYDVIVGGVSLVTNYRDEFNEQIKSGGIDGLIKTLQAKNQAQAMSRRSAPARLPLDGDRWTFDGDADVRQRDARARGGRRAAAAGVGRRRPGRRSARRSAALAVLLALRRRAIAEGRKLAFAAVPPMLDSLARVYGIEEFLVA